MSEEISKVLITEDEIKGRVKELGKTISKDYEEADEIFMVAILKGAVIFLADLAREIKAPVALDFMAVSSYGHETKSSGAVQIIKDVEVSLKGRHVLIIEDIVDTGLTLRYLIDNLNSRSPASVKTCVLLDKPSAREVEVPIHYKGFEIPDGFVVGYGLDYAQKYRNLPYIGILNLDNIK